MGAEREIDHVTGVETTGHEWDGIKELNKPLPKWWLYVLYVTIVWSIGYWIAYPAWPLVGEYTRGMLGYSQRDTVAQTIATARAAQAATNEAISRASLEEIKGDPKLLEFALGAGRAAFGDNCAPCHGRGAQGAIGYPNLNDDDWLWGGTLADIHQTILNGIRSTSADTRASAMPRFGIDKLLTEAQISDAADYVLSLAAPTGDAAAIERGKTVYAENCVACHGDDGKGNKDLGAPNLTDGIWLYGSSKPAIAASIATGRGGVMPSWAGRLDENTVKKLTVYVHSLGGGQ